jgi:hypothetical protein
MGLLDEAIRDHLELKRRRGADPAEVAREQHEALEPVSDRTRLSEQDPGGEHAAAVEASAADGDLPAEQADETTVLSTSPGAPEHAGAEGVADAGQISGMEETAELDMKAVFEHGTTDGADDPADASEPIPGQEHLQFDQQTAPGTQREQ